MADTTTRGQMMLRRIGAQDADVSVFQDGDQFEVEATGRGKTVKLRGANLLTMAKEVAKRLEIDPDSRAKWAHRGPRTQP